MSYREYIPHTALRSYIDAYWTVTTGPACRSFTSRILPDGAIDIICNLGAAVGNAGSDTVLESDKVYLVGTMTSFSDSLIQPEARLVGIRFKPAAFSVFYRMPLHQTADACIEFERELLNLGLEQDDFVTRLNRHFMNRLNVTSPVLFPVIDSIIHHKGARRIEELASQHFITQRQLERYFNQSVGVSVKAFSNIIRFRSVLRSIQQNTQLSLEDIALKHGYYDHAHLTRDIKKYTGTTPSRH